MAETKKRSYKAVIILAVLVLIAAGAFLGWKKYTSRIDYRLGKAGYSKEETAQIMEVFSEEEQETLASLSAVKEMIAIAKDERYQDDRFVDYLSGLAEGKDPEILLTDFDPLVIEFRSTAYYKEENLQIYLEQKKDPDPAYFGGEGPSGPTCQQIVIRINAEQVYSKIDGYDPALYNEYEAYRLKSEDCLATFVEAADGETLQNVVKHVNAAQLYKADPNYSDECLDLYVAYGEKHQDASVQDVIAHVNTAGTYRDEPYYIDAYLDRYEAYRASNPDMALYDVILAVNTGIDKPFYTDTQHADMSKGYLVLVNKFYYVSDADKPECVALGGYGYGEMEATAAEHFMLMVEGASADGIKLRSVNAYRTEAIQSTYYWGYVREASREAADTYSARPGHSEHQAGLAVDINTANISSHFENSREYAWLVEHCAEYGFILRYLPGKQYITGYVYEPWHYRYVGTEYAKDIMDSGLTFEEWYAFYVANPDNE